MAVVREPSKLGNPRLDDLWENYAEFLDLYRSSDFNLDSIQDIELQTLYNKLMITIGSSTMSIPELERNRLRVYDFIDTHYPTLLRRLKIQERLLTMTDKEISASNSQTFNQGQTPEIEISMNKTDEAMSVQNRSRTFNEISINDALIKQSLILDDTHWDTFITRFKNLFRPFIIPVMTDFHIWERGIDTEDEES